MQIDDLLQILNPATDLDDYKVIGNDLEILSEKPVGKTSEFILDLIRIYNKQAQSAEGYIWVAFEIAKELQTWREFTVVEEGQRLPQFENHAQFVQWAYHEATGDEISVSAVYHKSQLISRMENFDFTVQGIGVAIKSPAKVAQILNACDFDRHADDSFIGIEPLAKKGIFEMAGCALTEDPKVAVRLAILNAVESHVSVSKITETIYGRNEWSKVVQYWDPKHGQIILSCFSRTGDGIAVSLAVLVILFYAMTLVKGPMVLIRPM